MSKRVVGVGLLLFLANGNGMPKLLTIRELRDKPQYHKFSGMISFPLETFEERDVTFQKTIERLLIEEAGISNGEVEGLIVVDKKFQPIPGRSDIDSVYGYAFFTGNPGRDFVPKDDDIKFAGWKTMDELLSEYVRVEVDPILKHFQENFFRKLFGAL